MQTFRTRFTSDVSQHTAAMRQFRQDVSGAVSGARSQLLALGAIGLGGWGIKEVSSSIIKLAADMQSTKVAFEVMLGSAEKAKKVLGDLTRFADITPFQTDEVIRAGRQLMAAGTATEDLTKKLTLLGNIAAGTNMPLNDMVSLYAKMANKGKAQAEELNQMAERGIPIYKLLTDMLRINQAELVKMAEGGQLSFALITEALEKLGGKGGQYFGLIEKQSQTLSGLWSTLEGNVKMLATSFGELMIPQLSGYLDKIIAELDRMKQTGELDANMKKLADTLMGVLRSAVELGKWLNENRETLLATGKVIAYWMVWNKLNATLQHTSSLIRMMGTSSAALNGVSGATGMIASQAGQAAAETGKLSRTLAGIGPILSNIALAAGVAFTGWQIGKQIAEVMKLEQAFTRMFLKAKGKTDSEIDKEIKDYEESQKTGGKIQPSVPTLDLIESAKKKAKIEDQLKDYRRQLATLEPPAPVVAAQKPVTVPAPKVEAAKPAAVPAAKIETPVPVVAAQKPVTVPAPKVEAVKPAAVPSAKIETPAPVVAAQKPVTVPAPRVEAAAPAAVPAMKIETPAPVVAAQKPVTVPAPRVEAAAPAAVPAMKIETPAPVVAAQKPVTVPAPEVVASKPISKFPNSQTQNSAPVSPAQKKMSDAVREKIKQLEADAKAIEKAENDYYAKVRDAEAREIQLNEMLSKLNKNPAVFEEEGFVADLSGLLGGKQISSIADAKEKIQNELNGIDATKHAYNENMKKQAEAEKAGTLDAARKQSAAEEAIAKRKAERAQQIMDAQKKIAEERKKLARDMQSLQDEKYHDVMSEKIKKWQDDIDGYRKKIDEAEKALRKFGLNLEDDILKTPQQIAQAKKDELLKTKIEAYNRGAVVNFSKEEKARVVELQARQKSGRDAKTAQEKAEGDVKKTEKEVDKYDRTRREQDWKDRAKEMQDKSKSLGTAGKKIEEAQKNPNAALETVMKEIAKLLKDKLPDETK